MELVEALIHKELPRTHYFVDIPYPFGRLRLDLLSPVGVALTQTEITPVMERQINDILSKALQVGRDGDTAREEKLLLDAVKQYPYASSLYSALHDLYDRQDNLAEAEFYIKQVVALKPDYHNLAYLARNLGRQGKLEEAATIQQHLWETRSDAIRRQAVHLLPLRTPPGAPRMHAHLAETLHVRHTQRHLAPER